MQKRRGAEGVEQRLRDDAGGQVHEALVRVQNREPPDAQQAHPRRARLRAGVLGLPGHQVNLREVAAITMAAYHAACRSSRVLEPTRGQPELEPALLRDQRPLQRRRAAAAFARRAPHRAVRRFRPPRPRRRSPLREPPRSRATRDAFARVGHAGLSLTRFRRRRARGVDGLERTRLDPQLQAERAPRGVRRPGSASSSARMRSFLCICDKPGEPGTVSGRNPSRSGVETVARPPPTSSDPPANGAPVTSRAATDRLRYGGRASPKARFARTRRTCVDASSLDVSSRRVILSTHQTSPRPPPRSPPPPSRWRRRRCGPGGSRS